MCGIIGLVNSDPKSHVNQALVDALTILQHRGQDAAGIVTVSNNRFNLRKDRGTVAEVFTQDNVVSLRGNIGIGHVRYPTAGGSKSSEAQPLYSNFPFGIAIAHNGNLTNTEELISKMKNSYRHVNTDSDSEVLLNVFADELQRRQMSNITPDDIFDSVRIVMRKCKGAYAVVILINRLGLLAFRDPNGIRPLCFGTRQTSTGIDYAVASESVAIDALDPSFQLQRDVKGGEAIFISNRGELFSKNFHTVTKFAPCIFEYVYFARPDSILDGVQVYEARSMMGEKLAKKILMLHPEHDIDIVMPIPETSRTSALQCAHVLGRPYREGFIKNRYIARTFIMPGQEMRRKTVRLKLNTIKSEFRGKTVLLFDDSIVRGTTSMELVQMARDAGAKKVYFASAAPPVRFSNVYGIDIPTRGELVAHNRSVVDIQEFLGADMVIYNDLEDIISAVRDLNPTRLQDFECSCFDGRYVTPEVTPEYLLNLEQKRGAGRFGARVAGSPSPSYGLHSTTSGSGPIVGPNGNNNSNTTTVTTATTTANHNHHAACAGEADGLPTATLVAPMSPGPCKEDIPKERTPAGGVFAGQTLSGSGSHSSLLTVTGELELNSVSARSTGGGGGGGGVVEMAVLTVRWPCLTVHIRVVVNEYMYFILSVSSM
mmetsp:Transcript_4442/g.7272  ORF Transcript_4442/g.7272 Transcript_4442/m.7272 type:complete len:655 (+) Transcript_4442:211-2175(+)